MAYDEGLAHRIRECLSELRGDGTALTEKRMFGGLSFLLRGNMTVGVVGDELIARVGQETAEGALARPEARPMDFTGRPMRGWVTVGGLGPGRGPGPGVLDHHGAGVRRHPPA